MGEWISVDEDGVSEGLAGVADVLAQVREVVVGYRASLIAESFSETATEAMVVAAHNSTVEMVFAAMLKSLMAKDSD